ncbi:Uma2 family endonuclease [Myxococcus faecalis]|uniref:Uma2 family endonuclease n=1 Tax=Myxococcus faecalis TaxID=3115646 RepID=UPI0024CAD446|nr:Uma2 family endonuclease [Myxococcus sp. MH1]
MIHAERMNEDIQHEVRGRVARVVVESHPGGDMSDESPIDRSLYRVLEELPEHVVGEIIDGELHVSPRPLPPHGRAAIRLAIVLSPFEQGLRRRGPGGWVFLPEPELHLGPNVLVPDLAAWRHERMPELPQVVGMTTAPDWVCEVLSPSTASRDRGAKMNLYARAGVKHLWLLDPRQQQLEVYGLEAGRWTPCATHTGAVNIRAEPFIAQNMNLGSLFER